MQANQAPGADAGDTITASGPAATLGAAGAPVGGKRTPLSTDSVSILRVLVRMMIHGTEISEILQRVCSSALDRGGFHRAWIGLLDDTTGALSVAARAGAPANGQPSSPDAGPECVARAALSAGTRVVRDLSHPAPGEPPCHHETWSEGCRAAAAFPLNAGGLLLGVLVLYSASPDAFGPDTLRFLDGLANDLSTVVEFGRREAQRTRALAELRESEERYRELVRLSPVAILVDRGGHGVSFANPAALRLFGAADESELIGKTASDLMHPSHQEEIRRTVAHLRAGALAAPLIQKAVRVDGSLRDVEAHVALIQNGAEPVLQIVLDDVSERVAVVRSLWESENRLRKAQAMAHVGNWQIDLSVQRIWGSEEALRIYGADPEAPMPDLQTVQQCVVPEERARLTEALRDLVENGRAYDVEFRIRRLDTGELRTVHSRAEVVRTSSGAPTSIVGVIQDITDRTRVQQALRQSEARLLTTLYSIGDGVITTNLAGDIEQMNRSAETMTGWTEAEARGVPAREVFRLVDEETSTLQDGLVSRAISERKSISIGTGVALLARDGTLLSVSCSVSPIRAEEESPSGAIVVFEDKTRERTLEDQVRQSQKLEAVGRLAGGIAHDFNNIVSVVLGHTELLLDELKPADPMRESIRAIADAARRGAGLTRQLLAFARRQIVAPVPVDLNAAISSLKGMLGRLVGEDVELQFHPGENLWVTQIDPTQVDQVLANFATNARDAIEDTGTIVIETGNVTIDEEYAAERVDALPGDYVRLSFRDTGKGMDRATMAQIFEPFFTTKPSGQGTGLGLATVFGIVKQNGGFLTVDSEPDRGATFTIFLPRFYGAAQGALAPREELPVRGTETLLVVEDELQLLNLARLTLAGKGYTVLAASTPAEAIRACETHPGEIHLLLTDVVLPGMNGRELQEHLAPIRPRMKVMFMSGYTADVVAQRGIAAGEMEFLPKPFTPRVLVRAVRAFLDRAP